jgi:hypothetical protein
MHVGGIEDSTFLLLRAVAAGVDPEIAIMKRLSFRAILFVAVLSILHISAIAPLKVSAIQQPQETASQPLVPSRGTLSARQAVSSLDPQEKSVDNSVRFANF